VSTSFSFKIAKLIFKLMGIKKAFIAVPVDYRKLRKQDIHQPKGRFFKNTSQQFAIANSTITEIGSDTSEKKLVLFIHGGGFVSGPAKHHWDALRSISEKTNSTIWMCDYPKAPEHTIDEITSNIDVVYENAISKYPNHSISLIGDSVGGNLIATLIQRRIQNGESIPKQLILISPVMDASMTNPEIEKIDSLDIILSKQGVLSAKKMAADGIDLKDPIISPIYGSFSGFPKTTLFVASHDIMYPDQQLAIQKMKTEITDFEVIEGKEMPHIWPLLPIMKEAKIAFKQILERL